MNRAGVLTKCGSAAPIHFVQHMVPENHLSRDHPSTTSESPMAQPSLQECALRSEVLKLQGTSRARSSSPRGPSDLTHRHTDYSTFSGRTPGSNSFGGHQVAHLMLLCRNHKSALSDRTRWCSSPRMFHCRGLLLQMPDLEAAHCKLRNRLRMWPYGLLNTVTSGSNRMCQPLPLSAPALRVEPHSCHPSMNYCRMAGKTGRPSCSPHRTRRPRCQGTGPQAVKPEALLLPCYGSSALARALLASTPSKSCDLHVPSFTTTEHHIDFRPGVFVYMHNMTEGRTLLTAL